MKGYGFHSVSLSPAATELQLTGPGRAARGPLPRTPGALAGRSTQDACRRPLPGNATAGPSEIMLRHCTAWPRGLGPRDSRGHVKPLASVHANKLTRWSETTPAGGVAGALPACPGRADPAVSPALPVLCLTHHFMSLGPREAEGLRWQLLGSHLSIGHSWRVTLLVHWEQQGHVAPAGGVCMELGVWQDRPAPDRQADPSGRKGRPVCHRPLSRHVSTHVPSSPEAPTHHEQRLAGKGGGGKSCSISDDATSALSAPGHPTQGHTPLDTGSPYPQAFPKVDSGMQGAGRHLHRLVGRASSPSPMCPLQLTLLQSRPLNSPSGLS